MRDSTGRTCCFKRAVSVFGADAAAPPAVDLKEYDKIVQLAQENEMIFRAASSLRQAC